MGCGWDYKLIKFNFKAIYYHTIYYGSDAFSDITWGFVERRLKNKGTWMSLASEAIRVGGWGSGGNL